MNLKIKTISDELIKNLKSYLWFILFVVVYLLYFLIFHHDEPNCLVKHTFGIPCPGCGMTRGLLHLGILDFKGAFMYHPFSFLMPLIVVVFLFKGLPHIHKLYVSKSFWGVMITLYVTIYIARMVLYYPDNIPMDHYHGSFIDSLLH